MQDERNLDYRDKADLRYTETCLLGISNPRNRDAARSFLLGRKGRGACIGTRKQYAYSLRMLDNLTTGKDYLTLGRLDVEAFMGNAMSAGSPTTVSGWARNLKTFYRHYDPDTLRPFSWWTAWKIPAGHADRQVVTEAEFEQMLAAAGAARYGRGIRPDIAALLPLRDQSILWMMRDTGWRGSALCALNYGSVSFDELNGASVETPPGARRLKTRHFKAYIVRAVPSLKAWMSTRPGRPEEPLFAPLTSRPAAGDRMFFKDINKIVRYATRKADLRRIRPHDFKHTRATEMSRTPGWTAAKMNKALWSPGSKMGAVYEHLNFDDIRQQVRKDAGADALGRAVAEDPRLALSDAVAAAVTATMSELRKKGLA